MSGVIRTCGIDAMEDALQKRSCQVVDVREPSETRSASIEGTIPVPLSEFDRRIRFLDKKLPVYLLCRTGARARDAACRLAACGFEHVFVVEGGMKEWVEAGKGVVRASRVWSVERQARLATGLVVLLAATLSLSSPYFLFVAALVAAGQIWVERRRC